MRVGIFFDFVILTTRTPHGGASYVRRAKRNRIDPHRVELNGSPRVPRVCRRRWGRRRGPAREKER